MTEQTIPEWAKERACELLNEEEVLHEIALALPMAAWAEGKTLTVIVCREPLQLAKLRFAGFTSKPSAADLRGEPE